MAAIPMDTSNPWESLNENKRETNPNVMTNSSNSVAIEADSWADFSSFPSTEFGTSLMTSTTVNTSVTSSTVLPSMAPIHGSGSDFQFN